jgi:SIR2-like domain
MALVPNATTISVQETLDLLDGRFSTLASGVAENRYVFWLGSGISFGRVAGLKQVVAQVLEFLRVQIDPTNGDCCYKAALSQALSLAPLSHDEWTRVDYAQPFQSWGDVDAIVERLVNNYSRLLDVTVEGKPEDYLLWDGVNVTHTFADPTIEPDVEHLCIAILMLEGVASDIATANWDGLIERAVSNLNGGQPIHLVCVRQEDLRQAALRSKLIKFHGCAILAVHDQPNYRPFLVARQSQIHRWAAAAENAAIVSHLIGLVVSKPTLMIGLSAQDANIQALFAKAEATMAWPWPGDRPSYVFSGDQVGADQKILLRNVYRTAYTPAARAQINEGSLIKAYAKPLLVALVLSVTCAKMRSLIEVAPGTLDAGEKLKLQDGVMALRNLLARFADADRLQFIRSFVDHGSRTLTMFRDGSAGVAPRRYNPMTTIPVHQISNDQGVGASGMSEAAVLAGILGIGLSQGLWTLENVDVANPDAGIVRVTTGVARTKMLMAANGRTAVRLQQNGHLVDGDDAVLVYSSELPPTQPRSPRSAPGRTGHIGLREVSIFDLLQTAANANDLVQRFREAAAI